MNFMHMFDIEKNVQKRGFIDHFIEQIMY